MSTLPFRAREIGQPSFAPSAASWNDAWVAPGTTPRTVISAVWTVQPASALSAVISTVTEIRVGGVPALARLFEIAIEKQDAWAVASSSSGLVTPSASSVRAFQVVGRSAKTRVVAAVTLPLPPIRSPLQVASARRVVAMGSPRAEGGHQVVGTIVPHVPRAVRGGRVGSGGDGWGRCGAGRANAAKRTAGLDRDA